MGIVVAIVLVLGVLALHFNNRFPVMFHTQVTVSLTLVGVWNMGWYALRNVPSAWGWIALGSGATMLLAAAIIFFDQTRGVWNCSGIVSGLTKLTLTLFALVYVITIVQLNLGYPIFQ